MSLRTSVSDVTDCLDALDEAIEALLTDDGALDDTPAGVLMALLYCRPCARTTKRILLAHFYPGDNDVREAS